MFINFAGAVNTLKPNAERMKAVMAERNEIARQAKAEAELKMRTTGKTAMELYQDACKAKCDNEGVMTKEIRVALLGMARKGL